VGDVIQLVSVHRRRGEPCRVLGGGSNLLVDDRGPGASVISTDAFSWVRVQGEHVFAGAGVRLGELVTRSVRLGLSGLEPLAGIPGTLGGALCMNAGGPAGTVADVVERVDYVDRSGAFRHMPGAEMDWGYRRIRSDVLCITGAVLRLRSSTPDAVRRTWQVLRERKRRTQPLGVRSAGCFFRNPPYDSAGRLIDRAGLKGVEVGGAGVSEVHGNFLVNRGSASASDLFRLIEHVRGTVLSKFGVKLELEVKIWRPARKPSSGSEDPCPAVRSAKVESGGAFCVAERA
jgi:UDP-N-acetylmuramate dehydrogenase